MHKERPAGPTYQTAWQAFTGLFDKDRKPPAKDENQKDEDDEDDDDKRKGKR